MPPSSPEPHSDGSLPDVVEPAEARGAIQELLGRRAEFMSVFQPVISLRLGRVVGHEALLRLPLSTAFPGVAEAFAVAAKTDLLVDLEMAALEAHLGVARRVPGGGRLFINLSARAFVDPRMASDRLVEAVSAAGLQPTQVVLELTEVVDIESIAGLAEAVSRQRRAGFLFALDDFGAGFTNVRVLVELGPDFVKIDRSLVAGVSLDPRRRVFLEAIVTVGRRVNCSVVGEGVESPEDLAVLRACGIEYAQGWAVARPQPVELLSEPRLHANARELGAPTDESVTNFTLLRNGVSPATLVSRVIKKFDDDPNLEALAVVLGERALGLVTRGLLFSHLGHRYGFSIWNERRIVDFVTTHGTGFDRISGTASAEDAVEVVRRRSATRRFDPLVVETDDGNYQGLLPVDVLLLEITRLKVEYALQSNPLTGLPGSGVLARAVEARLVQGQPFALGWVDIDDFKPFNDRYGFTRGDEALTLLADILRRHLARDERSLLAHPGGDDFVFLAHPDRARSAALGAVEEFSAAVVDLYDPADRVEGGITSTDRRGGVRRFGFLTVSVGLVSWSGESGIDYRRLVEVAAEVKAAAKRRPGPAVVANERDLAGAPWLPVRPAAPEEEAGGQMGQDAPGGAEVQK